MKTTTTRLPSPLFVGSLTGDLRENLLGDGIDDVLVGRSRRARRRGGVGAVLVGQVGLLTAATTSATTLGGRVAAVGGVGGLVVDAIVETSEVVGFARLATDGVVAAFHVDEGRVFLVPVLLVVALAAGVAVAVRVETVRPAVLHGAEVDAAVGDRGGLGDLAERRACGAAASGMGLVAVVAGRHVGAALAVGVGEEQFEVVPVLDERWLTLVPVANIETEQSGAGENLEHDAELVRFLNLFAAGGRNALAFGTARPEAFHGFRRFPSGFKIVEILVEVSASHGSVAVGDVIDDGERRDGGEAGGVVLERGNPFERDSFEDLFLEGTLDAVVGIPVVDLTVPGGFGGSDQCIGVGAVEVDLGRWTHRCDEVERDTAGRSGKGVVFVDTEDEHGMAKIRSRKGGLDGRSVGETLLFEKLDGGERRSAGDRRERGVRHGGREIVGGRHGRSVGERRKGNWRVGGVIERWAASIRKRIGIVC